MPELCRQSALILQTSLILSERLLYSPQMASEALRGLLSPPPLSSPLKVLVGPTSLGSRSPSGVPEEKFPYACRLGEM